MTERIAQRMMQKVKVMGNCIVEITKFSHCREKHLCVVFGKRGNDFKRRQEIMGRVVC